MAAATVQGINGAKDLPALIQAIHAGVTYANVHSQSFPGGQIRGWLRRSDGPRPVDENPDRGSPYEWGSEPG
jgi:hypothetical protein